MIKRIIHATYAGCIRPLIRTEINRQRIKMLWDVWGYVPLLFIGHLTFGQRLYLLRRFLRIDWHVPHSHKPCEITAIVRHLARLPARPGELFIEAGCWQGGSSCKFSVIAKLLGMRLAIYDSFAGVEPLTPEEKAISYDFSGEYASPEQVLRDHLDRYGEPDLCEIHAGWFCDTLAQHPPERPIRAVYIDCDIAKGTREVLQGVMPTLVDDGWLMTQDYHIRPVRMLLDDPATWSSFGVAPAQFVYCCHNLAIAPAPSRASALVTS